MSNKYEHLFFDLDHTLWDFESNSKITLYKMFEQYQLAATTNTTKEEFYRIYIEINNQKWKLYSAGNITKAKLRKERFMDTFKVFNFVDPEFCQNFETEYMETCPHQTQLIPGTIEILEYLKGRYELHIITNGFSESQDIKMNKSGLIPFFNNVFSSELIGVNKPSPHIFLESLKRAKADLRQSIMIGDNLQADIVGASACGLDQVYFNPEKVPHVEKPTFEVSHLLQLKSLL